MTQQMEGAVPEFHLGDRLRKAREHAGLDQGQFAEVIGVSRGTVSNYERGTVDRYKPIVLRAWAMATGVSLTWLEHGTGGVTPPGGGRQDAVAKLAASKRGRTKKVAPGLVTREYLQVA